MSACVRQDLCACASPQVCESERPGAAREPLPNPKTIALMQTGRPLLRALLAPVGLCTLHRNVWSQREQTRWRRARQA
eukprot:4470812-Pleurochrysis_carterae.AAC.2